MRTWDIIQKRLRIHGWNNLKTLKFDWEILTSEDATIILDCSKVLEKLFENKYCKTMPHLRSLEVKAREYIYSINIFV